MLKNNRKGNEISMNMIILAVLALLVLLIMAVLLMGGFSNWNKGTSCETQDGKCAQKTESCGEDAYSDYPLPSAYTCPKEQKCCIKASFGGT